MNLLEKIKLNYSEKALLEVLGRKQEIFNLETLNLSTITINIKSINLNNKSNIQENNDHSIYFTYTKDSKAYILKEDINYITKEGVLIYEKDLAEWRLYFYNDNNEKYICKSILDYFKPSLKEDTLKKVDIDFTETCWECGSKLVNGICNTCNCQDEIF